MEFTKVMEIKRRVCLNRSCSICPLGEENKFKCLFALKVGE